MAKFVRKLLEQLKLQIKKINKSYAKNSIKGKKGTENQVLVHMKKEILSSQRKFRLQPIRDLYFKFYLGSMKMPIT